MSSYLDSLIGFSTVIVEEPPPVSYAPILNAFTDADPCPRVEVLFTTFAAGTASVTVHRLAAGREYLVRGAVNAPVAGALSRIDFEVPFGVEAEYRAEMFDSSGASLGFTDPATVTLDVTETWVHNPLDPAGATTVWFRKNALRDIHRPVEGSRVWPDGRTAAVIVSGQRRGIQDAVLDVIVDSIDQADKLQALFGDRTARTVPVLCFRAGSGDGASARLRIPRPFFAGVLDPSEQDVDYTSGMGEKIAFAMTGDETDPPTPALIIPLLTRADLNAAFPTRVAFNAFYLTRLAANRDYDKAGTGS
jgi:hypothetical protein